MHGSKESHLDFESFIIMATILTSVAGALIVASIIGIFKTRWLYVIAPKLYLNTPISEGQIISLDLYNAGLLAEEDVTLTIRPACKFELIAKSKSTLNVTGNLLTVTKLSRLEKVTILLLVEGKAFGPEDIEGIESKATKGKIVESKDKATAVWQSIIGLPIVLLVLFVPFAFGTSVGAEMKISAWQLTNNYLELFGRSTQLAGYQATLREDYSTGKLKGVIKDKKIDIQLDEIVRHGEKFTLTFSITNHISMPVLIDGRTESSAGDIGPFSYEQTRIENFALSPNEKKTAKVSIYLPDEVSVKIIQCNFTIKTLDGDTLYATQSIRLDKN